MVLNLTRITHDNYFKVPSSMVELFVEVLNTISFSAKDLLLYDNYTMNLVRLIVILCK